MTPTAAAWVGAMIEGEGNITIDLTRRHGRGSIRVVNTNVETIATVLRLVGDGGIYFWPRNEKNKHWLPAWAWDLASVLALRSLLPQVIPFLTGKQAVAERLLAEVSSA